MKVLALLACLVGPALAHAEHHEYFVNKGVKYHIGDNHFSLSEDSSFMDTFPVVGQEWKQSFTVDRVDKVHVRIEHIWGVDNCPYCKILVSINGRDLGRITEENNHEPYYTLSPLAQPVQPGVTYTLKIASFGTDQVDDFVMENVVIETDEAEVRLVGPEPMTKEPPPVEKGFGCRGSHMIRDWLPADMVAQGSIRMKSAGQFEEHQLSATLAPEYYIEGHWKLGAVDAGNLVGQAFEVLLGTTERNGWVFSFMPGNQQILHGNMQLGGVYRSKSFTAPFKAGAWNTVRVARCPDGRAVLYLNEAEIGEGISGLGPNEAVSIRARGMTADFSPTLF